MPDAPIPLPGAADTIAAIATAPGRGALAVVRVSGPGAHAVGARVLAPWRPEARRAARATVRHPGTGEVADEVVAVVYAGPRSYTGEDALELTTHGGAVAPALVLAAVLAAGARPALPGEFTRRAVARGRLDVLQAEAVADVIDARSRSAHRAALEQLDGGLSRRVRALRDAVLALEALIAYDIDFPEEDDGPVPAARIARAADELLAALDALLATAGTGELVREGAVVVIAGAPNVGKSSLFNALVGHARAIVTDVPGTTRDAIEAVLDVGPWPVRLVDTAGLRETADVVERLGIEVSERWLARADVVLACGDDDESLGAAAARAAALTAAPVVAVRTKGDRDSAPGTRHPAGGGGPPGGAGSSRSPAGASATSGGPPPKNEFTAGRSGEPHQNVAVGSNSSPRGGAAGGAAGGAPPVVVSAHSGAGLRELAERIEAALDAAHGAHSADVPLLTRERHARAVALAREEVAAFRDAWGAGALPAPVAAVHLRAASGALESLIGVVDVEDVLDRVFASFCVGK